MKNNNQWFFVILYIFCAWMLIRSIYKAFFLKLETVDDYMKRAHYAVSFFKARNYALRLLQKALSVFPDVSAQEFAFIHFQIGYLYFEKKDFEKAVEHFDLAWPFLKKSKLSYSRAYAALVVANYNVGNKEKAREWYHYLRRKEQSDPRFQGLSYLERSIFK